MVEPMSLLCFGGAALVATVNHLEKRSEKAQRVPPSLPCAMDYDVPAGSEGHVDYILFVHVANATLGAQLSEREVKIRIKYGDPGESITCDTNCALASFKRSAASKFVAQLHSLQQSQVVASFDTTCLFMAVTREMPLRIRLIRSGRSGQHTIATAELLLPPLNVCTPTQQRTVGLRDTFGNEIGRLDLNLGFHAVARNHLKMQLQNLGAHRRQGAFILKSLNLVEGTVVDSSLEERCN